MRKLFKKKDRRKEQVLLKPIEVDFARIDEYILRKYGLKDIKKKDLFMLLNILFLISGVLSIVAFMYKKVNAVSIIGALSAVVLGTIIFRMVKKHGVKIEEKQKKEKEDKKE